MRKIIDLTAAIRQQMINKFDKVWVKMSVEEKIEMLSVMVDVVEKKNVAVVGIVEKRKVAANDR